MSRSAVEEEVREVLRQVAVYAGLPNVWNAPTLKASLEGFVADEADAPDGETGAP
jgi:hypothetical protein